VQIDNESIHIIDNWNQNRRTDGRLTYCGVSNDYYWWVLLVSSDVRRRVVFINHYNTLRIIYRRAYELIDGHLQDMIHQ
jgi:hypothetical protein